MGEFDVKLTLTERQRKRLDRLAKPSGLKTGPWARSVLLGLPVKGPGDKATPASNPAVLGSLPGGARSHRDDGGSIPPATAKPRHLLTIPSYDPDTG